MSHGNNRVALVTGAAQGIGKAVAEKLEGAGVVTAAADIIALGDWPADHPASTRHHLDIRSDDACRTVVADVVRMHGRLDYLVNNAGIIRRAPTAEMAVEDFQAVLDVNVTGAFRMCQAAYRSLSSARGSIVNVASVNGLRPIQGSIGYGVSKAGLIHLTRILALEWAQTGIRVNAVAPTLVETAINAEQRADDSWHERAVSAVPLGRAATVEEVASAVLFLLGTDASMTTGTVLPVDGGMAL